MPPWSSAFAELLNSLTIPEPPLGIFDLAARPWLKNGKLTLAMPPSLFIKIFAAFRESFIYKQKRYNGKKELMFGWPEAVRRAGEFEKRMSGD